MKLLEGKKALVTGARKGIGRGVAYSLAEQGADVGVNDLIDDKEINRTLDLIESTGAKATFHQADVSSKKEIDLMIDDFLREHKQIDILVNNAIMQPQNKPFFEIDEQWWDDMISLSLKGYFFASQRAAKEMISRDIGGRIVCLSSVHSEMVLKDWVVYGIAKMGLRRMVKGMAVDLAGTGIHANCIAPGPINNQTPEEGKIEPDSIKMDWIPVGRQGLPSDIANAVVFLCSSMGDFINGETILVDGGMVAKGLVAPPSKLKDNE